jgi:hypothetical protein
MGDVDVLGIAELLPIDHTFWVGKTRGKASAVRELKLKLSRDDLDTARPHVSFLFESYRRSGGGRIANTLACLGAAGQDVTVYGAVVTTRPDGLC